MIERHPCSGGQVATDLGSEIHRVLEDSVRRPIESAPGPDRFPHRNWEMFAIWSFVVVSFASLIFASYVIWAKCNGR